MNEKQMQDMAVSILLDEYTQLDVAQLLKEYDEAEENGEVPNTTDTLDEACNRMIQREFSKKKQKKIIVRVSKVLSRVAMVTLMLIGLCTVSVLSVKAWRMPVLRFVLETFDRYSTVGMEGDGPQDNITLEEILERLAESISKDYKLAYKSVQDGNYQVMYFGKQGQKISLIVTTNQHETFFDTENVGGNPMWINGYEAIVVEKNGCSIMWLDDEQGLLYNLYTNNLNKEELLDIAYVLTR